MNSYINNILESREFKEDLNNAFVQSYDCTYSEGGVDEFFNDVEATKLVIEVIKKHLKNVEIG